MVQSLFLGAQGKRRRSTYSCRGQGRLRRVTFRILPIAMRSWSLEIEIASMVGRMRHLREPRCSVVDDWGTCGGRVPFDSPTNRPEFRSRRGRFAYLAIASTMGLSARSVTRGNLEEWIQLVIWTYTEHFSVREDRTDQSQFSWRLNGLIDSEHLDRVLGCRMSCEIILARGEILKSWEEIGRGGLKNNLGRGVRTKDSAVIHLVICSCCSRSVSLSSNGLVEEAQTSKPKQ